MDNSKATAREPATADVGPKALLSWAPCDDYRVRPLLLAEASRRDATDWSYDDAENVIGFLLAVIDGPALSRAAPSSEPFGYWIEQKGAEPALLRKPAYIPEPSDLRTVTPLYAAPSSGHAMAEGEREINCAVCGESVKHTSAGYCFSCIKGFKVPLATTPPTTNDAMPAGWHPRIGERVEVADHVDDSKEWRELSLWVSAVRIHDTGDGYDVTVAEQWPMPRPGFRGHSGQTDGFRIGAASVYDDLRPLATPKPSPTPKGGLPGRGEVDALIPALKAWDAQHDDRVQPLLLAAADMRGASRWGCDDAEKVVAFLLSLAPAEAIRDGGEGGEG